jgi:hypothetical protein
MKEKDAKDIRTIRFIRKTNGNINAHTSISSRKVLIVLNSVGNSESYMLVFGIAATKTSRNIGSVSGSIGTKEWRN